MQSRVLHQSKKKRKEKKNLTLTPPPPSSSSLPNTQIQPSGYFSYDDAHTISSRATQDV